MLNTPHFLPLEQILEVLSLSKIATAIYISEDLHIQYANDEMIRIWGKDKNVIGKTVGEALPEIKEQPFIEILQNVWKTASRYEGKDTPAKLEAGGVLRMFYFDFTYRAITDDTGATFCILHTTQDVTESYLNRKEVEQGKKREQDLNEELATINEELRAANEDLAATNEELASSNEELSSVNEEYFAINEELTEAQEELRQSLARVEQSEDRFQRLIRDATTGIIVLEGEALKVVIVNTAYANLIGRTAEDLYDRPLFEVIPEAEKEFRAIIDQVRNTGEAVFLYEQPYSVFTEKGEIKGYLNLIYQPFKEGEGEIKGVMVLCQDVTEQVNARNRLAQAEERVRLAIAAADLGTFDYSFKEEKIITSQRFNDIMGVEATQDLKNYLKVIHPDDLDIRKQAHEDALQTGKLEYILRILKNGEICWVRAEGTMYFDEMGLPERLLGVMQEVTEQKLIQQRKDDFISIASHELKTPVTSLKASLQLMDRLKSNSSKDAMPKLLLQARRSVERVSILIEDLLHVGRLQETEMQLRKSTFILSQLINGCANPISLSTRHVVKIKGELNLEIQADEHRIEQVVTNMLNNAVKYAPDSVSIDVIIRRDNEMVRVDVTDYGKGIPAEKLPHLFKRYYRAEPIGHYVSGLGLGLYISAEIIRKHGGDVSVISEVNKGSTFSFTLPIVSG